MPLKKVFLIIIRGFFHMHKYIDLMPIKSVGLILTVLFDINTGVLKVLIYLFPEFNRWDHRSAKGVYYQAKTAFHPGYVCLYIHIFNFLFFLL